MSYKRLTKSKVAENIEEKQALSFSPLLQRKHYERLAELEDKIENGTLIELPCKVGDKVYVIEQDWDNDYNYFYYIDEYKFTLDFLYNWGKTVFLTKAEAEAKLKELQNER